MIAKLRRGISGTASKDAGGFSKLVPRRLTVSEWEHLHLPGDEARWLPTVVRPDCPNSRIRECQADPARTPAHAPAVLEVPSCMQQATTRRFKRRWRKVPPHDAPPAVPPLAVAHREGRGFGPRRGRRFARLDAMWRPPVWVVEYTGVDVRRDVSSTDMAEKREQKDKNDKPTTVSAAPVAATPVAAAPVEKKNTPPKPRIPQLAKKNKSRLPRRQKKALQQAAHK